MKKQLRRSISETPFLYKTYFHFYRKHRGICPSFFTNNTNLYFDGYPRSGNTFLASLVAENFKGIETVHHLHKVAPVKIALKLSIPCFILVRDPAESISSNYLKHFSLNGKMPEKVDRALLQRMVDDYFYYYTYVEKIRNQVYIIQFQDLIQFPAEVIRNIRDKLNLRLSNIEIESSTKIAVQYYKGATDKYGSSRPNPFKDKEKKKLKPLLKNIDKFNKASNLFEGFIYGR